MIHYDNLIKAEKMKYYNDYETLLFARAKGNIKSVTGVLPLTFTAKGGNAADWVIYGNDENGTENLFNKNANDIENGYISANFLTSNGKTGESPACFVSEYIPVLPSISYVLKRGTSTGQSLSICQYDINKEYTTGTAYSGRAVITFTTESQTKYIRLSAYYTEQSAVMLVKGSTAPDHYIPYQKGVGERTANKMSAPANGVYSANRTTVTVTNGVYRIEHTAEGSGSSSVYIDIPEFEIPDSGYINYLNSASYGNVAAVLLYKGTALSNGDVLGPINKSVAIGSDYAGKRADQILIYTATGSPVMDFTMSPMIADSNTYTTYIPYGYQIPLIISQQGEQPDKTYDIYIGDTPLTAGQQVSKTSTGQDIELFSGENTFDTSLYNKPEMKIDYK